MSRVDWARLGLKGNPFENVAPGEHLDWVDVPPSIRAALHPRPFRVELIGHKGAGKTTTLAWYAATHPDAQRVYVTGPTLGPLPWEGTSVLCLDEANNAAPDALAWLDCEAAARGVSLLLGTHWSLAAHLTGLRSFALAEHVSLSWVSRRVAAHAVEGRVHFDFDAVARALLPRVSFINYGLLRVLYELAENLARGVEPKVALDDALRRAAEDDTLHIVPPPPRP